MWKLPDDDLEALIRSFERSEWREMRLQMDGVELVLAKDAEPQWRTLPPAQNTQQVTASESPAPVREATPSASASAAPKQKAPRAVPQGWVQVRAPSLGTFYRSPKPGAPPFVEVGGNVGPDTEICLIEVMKLFTTVSAGVQGTVREIYAGDSELVEYNQPLFLVEP
jgi:acetyl-CoA carboxylase biotin carboxyl carrier protein